MNKNWEILRCCAVLSPDTEQEARLRKAIPSVQDTNGFIELAEEHGLSALIHFHCQKLGINPPGLLAKPLLTMRLRHRQANQIRGYALAEIIDLLNQQDVKVAVLKGAALAHLLYPLPELRPMRDIDLLVGDKQLHHTQALIRSLGYRVSDNPMPQDHHHLTTLTKTIDRLSISIEVHRDAVSRDNVGSLTLDRIETQQFGYYAHQAWTLGHIDMLRHLSRHSFEFGKQTKLGNAVDTLGYASKFANDIDWQKLHKTAPDVVTSLQMLSLLAPCPANLSTFLVIPDASLDVPGIGCGMPPLTTVRNCDKPWATLLYPSRWWLRGFYSVPAPRSLWWTQWVTHPLRVCYWLWRRIKSRRVFGV